MKLGLRLVHLQHDVEHATRVVEEADRLGFESVWVPDHVVLPVDVETSPESGHPDGVASGWSWFDPLIYLGHLGARTRHIRLGTNVYVLALRNPLVAARAIQTLDSVSGGRVVVGIGAGWVRGEWDAVAVDFASRGRRLVEAIEVCRRLWSDPVVEHHGEFFDFGPVHFEPKPVQRGGPPLLFGGESRVALRRAADLGDGWIGRDHDPVSVRPIVAALTQILADRGRARDSFEITVRARSGVIDDIQAWKESGIDRLIISPWRDCGHAVTDVDELLDGVRTVARSHLPHVSGALDD